MQVMLRLILTPPAHPAASCEVVAFALGGLTSMPALRNFSGAWRRLACLPLPLPLLCLGRSLS